MNNKKCIISLVLYADGKISRLSKWVYCIVQIAIPFGNYPVQLESQGEKEGYNLNNDQRKDVDWEYRIKIESEIGRIKNEMPC